jgi:hypothetical protein
MAAQLLADLRDILGDLADYVAHPLVLAALLLAIWFLWRRALH